MKELDFNPKDLRIERLLGKDEEEGNMLRILKGEEGHALSDLMEQSFEGVLENTTMWILARRCGDKRTRRKRRT